MLIKTRWLLLAGLILCATSTLAGSEFVLETPRSALEFQVGSDFTLSSFEGSMISWKRLSSETRGWRVGLSPAATYSKTDDLGPNTYINEEQNYRLDIDVQRLYLGPLNGRTRSYWGLGPSAGIAYQSSRADRSDSTGAWTNYRSEIRRTWSVGAAAVVGVEYFFLPSMSLTGEYGFNLNYEVSSSSWSDRRHKSFEVYSRRVRLGLSVFY